MSIEYAARRDRVCCKAAMLQIKARLPHQTCIITEDCFRKGYR